MRPQATFRICGRVCKAPERGYYSLTDESKYKVLLSLEVPAGDSGAAQVYEVDVYGRVMPAAEKAQVGQWLCVEGWLDWKPYTSQKTGKKGLLRTLVAHSLMWELKISGREPAPAAKPVNHEEVNESEDDIPF